MLRSALTAVLSLCVVTGLRAQGNSITADKQALIFSAVRGTDSRPDTLAFSRKDFSRTGEKMKMAIHIEGEQRKSFRLLSSHPSRVAGGQKMELILVFSPDSSFTGVATAKLRVVGDSGRTLSRIDLRGLSLQGLEGHNEPPLASVFDALGYAVNPGWTGLKNNLQPDPQGDEIHAWAFRKAGKGKVELLPVARFSPDYALPFGYYTSSSEGPQTHQLGVLTRTDSLRQTAPQDQALPKPRIFPQHQTLFPALSEGTHSFDPGGSVFGLYTTSPTHTAYTADDWNLLSSAGKAAHATRIYPAKNASGKPLANTYLVCYEEAQNGDYQDYVFVIRNVKPLTEQEEWAVLLNGKDLDGWDIFLQKIGLNNDPEHNFSVEDGSVHVRGKDLGYIRTKERFSNYHFKVEFKWGEKKWPPREGAKRDAGICYNIPGDEPDSIWPRSIECQIQEGDVGDFWLLSGSTIVVDGNRNVPSNHTRVIKKKDAEKPTGEWNTVEVISCNGHCIQVVNGVVVNEGDNASVKNGRILLQSEYSEVYYRNAEIRKL